MADAYFGCQCPETRRVILAEIRDYAEERTDAATALAYVASIERAYTIESTYFRNGKRYEWWVEVLRFGDWRGWKRVSLADARHWLERFPAFRLTLRVDGKPVLSYPHPLALITPTPEEPCTRSASDRRNGGPILSAS